MNAQAFALTPTMRRFVLHWGEMGTRWGVNRTVAQIHALLFVAARPMTAEEIVEALDVARSNVSTSLRELEGWRLAKRVPVQGDRREHFETHQDVWELFRVILEERKRREIDPTLQILRDCVAEASKGGTGEHKTRERLAELLDFVETTTGWFDEVRTLSTATLRRLIRLGGRVQKVLAALP